MLIVAFDIFLLSMISCAFNINIISETSNWLFLVLFPLLLMAGFGALS